MTYTDVLTNLISLAPTHKDIVLEDASRVYYFLSLPHGIGYNIFCYEQYKYNPTIKSTFNAADASFIFFGVIIKDILYRKGKVPAISEHPQIKQLDRDSILAEAELEACKQWLQEHPDMPIPEDGYSYQIRRAFLQSTPPILEPPPVLDLQDAIDYLCEVLTDPVQKAKDIYDTAVRSVASCKATCKLYQVWERAQKNPSVYAQDWEIQMYSILDELKTRGAKTVSCTISLAGKTAEGKIDITLLLSKILTKCTLDSWNFVNKPTGVYIFESLGLNSPRDQISIENITTICYRGNIVYRNQSSTQPSTNATSFFS